MILDFSTPAEFTGNDRFVPLQKINDIVFFRISVR